MSDVETPEQTITRLSECCHCTALTFLEIGDAVERATKNDTPFTTVELEGCVARARDKYDKLIADNHGKVPVFEFVL